MKDDTEENQNFWEKKNTNLVAEDKELRRRFGPVVLEQSGEQMREQHRAEILKQLTEQMDQLREQNHAEVLEQMKEQAQAFEKQSALDKQTGGDHYKKLAIQPIEYCHRNGLGVCESFVVKYVTRYKDKNGKEDLLKAIHCLELLIEMEYGSTTGEQQ